jgi:lysozyme family protein
MSTSESARPEPPIAALLEREGAFVDDPSDSGGPTRFGITEAAARAAGYDGPMEHLPRGLAEDIYRRRYWTAPGFDRVAAGAPAIAAELFDTGVNMGPETATRFLQRALNALNRGGRDYPDIAVDGCIGPATLAALSAHTARRGTHVLLKALNALQGARYIALAERRSTNERFLSGWLAKRVDWTGDVAWD